ncbi:Na+/H+ antiporter subunit E [Thermus sediminis]|uniref:Na+/H+ antiporter subunit E n=1 Tax=Thermus sediminis TaxID=1761908 RepID=UPI000E3BA346|nr:Na+/H+ antiporter subunit E [Thermus sediminis]
MSVFFLLNLLLALIWAAISGSVSATNLSIGFLVGYVLIWLADPLLGSGRYARQVFVVLGFLAFFVKELVLSSLRVARDVLSLDYERRVSPGIVAIPLDLKSNLAITLLANTISLTPGTLSLDVSEEDRVLYIHSMYVSSPEAVREEIKGELERRVREVVGG